LYFIINYAQDLRRLKAVLFWVGAVMQDAKVAFSLCKSMPIPFLFVALHRECAAIRSAFQLEKGIEQPPVEYSQPYKKEISGLQLLWQCPEIMERNDAHQ
jgi:hypothetical protein